MSEHPTLQTSDHALVDELSALQQAPTPIITGELSEEAKLKLEVIQSLLEPCDKATYGQKLRDAAARLGKSVRSVQRLVKQWEEEGLTGIVGNGRADKGQHRIDEDWQKFIIKTYQEGNKGSKRITPAQVAVRVKVRARELGVNPPSHMTVYRVLNPIIEKQEKAKSIRSPGWRGSRLSLKTRDGQELVPEYSNHIWQCDHTRADVLLVDQHGEILGRPWLTTVVDTYSRCIVGINLGYAAPSSEVIALALRHAILPKQYGVEYELLHSWGTYGIPQHFYTDGGKDFRSNHLQQIGVQLGFSCHLRDRPSEGGIVERPFKTLNTEFFSTLHGYTGSNVQERPKDAEKDACLTLRELERLLVRYIAHNYNQRFDARMGDQTRFQRWEAGLIAAPQPMAERELDICLMKQSRRTIQRGGYLQFENLMYRGETLAGYAGETVVVRFDPKDITTILVYQRDGVKEHLLAKAHAQDLETEVLSLDEAKAISRKLRETGKAVTNHSYLSEISDRDTFTASKKSRKTKQKEEQAQIRSTFQKAPVAEQEVANIQLTETSTPAPIAKMPRVFDYDQLRDDYGW
uniref:Mu transposase C-terminal domain-containing protein n=1 Tax=Trichocoleus desertorum TaxID=1481672 RepID=UPI0025B5A8DB|nr:Mu transposase C-terminal domain-containing protein [Trichocoleus desertorum]